MTDAHRSDQQLAPAPGANPGAGDPLADLRAAVLAAAQGVARSSAVSVGAEGDGGAEQGRAGKLAQLLADDGPITLERPRRAQFGDYSTNAALLLSPAVGSAPRELADAIGRRLQDGLAGVLERFEVAGPGFLNLFVSDSWLLGALAHL